MARQIITEADVEQWVKWAGVTQVVLHDNDTVTALAHDTAYELGLRFVERVAGTPAAVAPAEPPLIDLALVTSIVATVLARYAASEQ